jgi:cold shock CspA family protein
MASLESSVKDLTLNTVLTGCVKWFNNNLNYGFITVLSPGEYNNKDIFCHQSNIKTKHECFRTLYTGECVQFEITKSDNEKHPYHGVNISGFNGCMLHCENPSYHLNSNNGNRGNRGNRDNRDSSSSRGRGNGGRDRGGRGGGSQDRTRDTNTNIEINRKQ